MGKTISHQMYWTDVAEALHFRDKINTSEPNMMFTLVITDEADGVP